MDTEAKIKELKAIVPYLAAEYNDEALRKVVDELMSLAMEDLGRFREMIREDILTSSNCRIARLAPIAYEDKYTEEIRELMKTGTDYADESMKAVVQRWRKEYPLSVKALWFDYQCLHPKGKRIDDAFSSGEGSSELLKEEKGLEKVLHIVVDKISIPNKDYDMAYNVYIAVKDYPAARALRYRQGMEAMEQEKFDEAHRFFLAALDHPGAKEKAEQAARAIEVRKAFLEKVGDTKTYLSRRIGETHSATLRELRAQQHKAYINTPEIGVGSLIFCFVGFLLSLAMHTDPDMDNNAIYIFFPLAMSIALHMMFDMDFGWIKSCAITFGILILPKILHDFSVDLFDTPTPAFVLLNLICAVPLVVALVSALRKIPAKRAYLRVVILRGELKPVESKLRAELIDEFTPLVGRELAEKWVKELRSGI